MVNIIFPLVLNVVYLVCVAGAVTRPACCMPDLSFLSFLLNQVCHGLIVFDLFEYCDSVGLCIPN